MPPPRAEPPLVIDVGDDERRGGFMAEIRRLPPAPSRELAIDMSGTDTMERRASDTIERGDVGGSSGNASTGSGDGTARGWGTGNASTGTRRTGGAGGEGESLGMLVASGESGAITSALSRGRCAPGAGAVGRGDSGGSTGLASVRVLPRLTGSVMGAADGEGRRRGEWLGCISSSGGVGGR
jgi:hypothetical protein